MQGTTTREPALARGLGTRPGDRRKRPVPARVGLSLVEILVSASVFGLTAGATTYAIITTVFLNRTNQETALALDAAKSTLEALQGEQFSEVFVRFNATTTDDPVGGASPGNGFAVDGLDVRADDADGLAGEIVFPGDGVMLREDFVDADLGMPRDLNDDGVQNALNHKDDYRILPVRVRVQWRGAMGNRAIELVTTLAYD